MKRLCGMYEDNQKRKLKIKSKNTFNISFMELFIFNIINSFSEFFEKDYLIEKFIPDVYKNYIVKIPNIILYIIFYLSMIILHNEQKYNVCLLMNIVSLLYFFQMYEMKNICIICKYFYFINFILIIYLLIIK